MVSKRGLETQLRKCFKHPKKVERECDPLWITFNIKSVSLPSKYADVLQDVTCWRWSGNSRFLSHTITAKITLHIKSHWDNWKFGLYHVSLLYCFPCFPNSTQLLSSKTTTAFDMEIKLLIWSYVLLWRDYTRYMTIRWSRQTDEIFSKHWHFLLRSSFISSLPEATQTVYSFFFFFIIFEYLCKLYLEVNDAVFGLVLHL